MKKRAAALVFIALFCLMTLLVGSNLYAGNDFKEVRFGIITALSGPASPWGIPNSRAMMLDAERINNEGGFIVDGDTYKWKVFTYDHEYIPARAVRALNRAIHNDNVSFVSVQGGAPLLACIPTLKQNNMLSLSEAAGGKAVTNPDNPLVFRYNPAIEGAYAAGLDYLIEKYGIRTVASINPDDEAGRSAVEALSYVNKVGDFNIEVVGSEFIERGSQNFVPVLSRIIRRKPDLIETGMMDPSSQALLLKQARELGYEGQIYLVWGPNEAQVLRIAGSLAEGVYMGTSGPLEPDTEGAKDLYARFLEKYDADEWDANYYTHSALFTPLTKAIEKAQSFDPNKIADVMQDLEWQGAQGTHYFGGEKLFGIKRQMVSPTTLRTVQNGEVVTAKRAEVPPGILD